jgi:hypothetical protein
MLSLTPLLLQHVWGRSNRYLFWDGGIALSMSLEVCIPALFCTLLSKVVSPHPPNHQPDVLRLQLAQWPPCSIGLFSALLMLKHV